MNGRTGLVATLVAVAIVLPWRPVAAQSSDGLTAGAGAGVYPSGTTFNGVPITGLRFGIGIALPANGTVSGQFQTVLLGLSALGQPQEISVEGEATSGAVNADGSSTFSGTCTIDMGGGTPPLTGVPFTITSTTNSLLLILGGTTLPTASVTAGSITIQ